MPIQIIKADILSIRCDAIINPTDEVLSGSRGLDAEIHSAAGESLRRECDKLGSLEIGAAAITHSHLHNCRYVIHTAAPWWQIREQESIWLHWCYRNSLKIASECDLESLAVPLIGSGTRAFSRELVLRIATEEIAQFLEDHDDVHIILVIQDKAAYQPDSALLAGLEKDILFIRWQEKKARERDWDAVQMASTESFPAITAEDIEAEWREESSKPQTFPGAAPPLAEKVSRPGAFHPREAQKEYRPAHAKRPIPLLPFGLFQLQREEPVLDESFSQMVLRKIDEKGFQKDSDCYRRANMDRRLFSRIRSDKDYHPKKTTALALAIALELSLDETKELLLKAGYGLSHSILLDVIVEYCISRQCYNIYEINELLFQYDQPQLGE